MVNWARRRKKENLQNVLYHSVAVSLHSLSHSQFSRLFVWILSYSVYSCSEVRLLFKDTRMKDESWSRYFFVESRLIILVLVTIPILFQLILVLILLRRTGCTDQFSRYCTDVLSTTSRGYSTQEEYEELVVEAGTTSTTNSSYSSSSNSHQQQVFSLRFTSTKVQILTPEEVLPGPLPPPRP